MTILSVGGWGGGSEGKLPSPTRTWDPTKAQLKMHLLVILSLPLLLGAVFIAPVCTEDNHKRGAVLTIVLMMWALLFFRPKRTMRICIVGPPSKAKGFLGRVLARGELSREAQPQRFLPDRAAGRAVRTYVCAHRERSLTSHMSFGRGDNGEGGDGEELRIEWSDVETSTQLSVGHPRLHHSFSDHFPVIDDQTRRLCAERERQLRRAHAFIYVLDFTHSEREAFAELDALLAVARGKPILLLINLRDAGSSAAQGSCEADTAALRLAQRMIRLCGVSGGDRGSLLFVLGALHGRCGCGPAGRHLPALPTDVCTRIVRYALEEQDMRKVFEVGEPQCRCAEQIALRSHERAPHGYPGGAEQSAAPALILGRACNVTYFSLSLGAARRRGDRLLRMRQQGLQGVEWLVEEAGKDVDPFWTPFGLGLGSRFRRAARERSGRVC